MGALAVVRTERGAGLAVLLRFAALFYGSRVRGGTHCLVTVPPARAGDYETAFGFSKVREDLPHHGFQRPAVLMDLAMERVDEWSDVYPDPPAGWHTVRSLMKSSSSPRADFDGELSSSRPHFEALLPAALNGTE